MRISVDEEDPGFATWQKLKDTGQEVKILFNGEEIEGGVVITADEDESFILVVKKDAAGNLILNDDKTEFARFPEFGEVKLVIAQRPYDAGEDIKKHIAKVRSYLEAIAVRLHQRGAVHDESKFHPLERGLLQELGELEQREGKVAFGTPEYALRMKLLAPMLEHHYANNDHHPEHFAQGIIGMTLMSLTEMFCDWAAAASDREPDGVWKLSAACEKYGVPAALEQIFRNTANELGFKHE